MNMSYLMRICHPVKSFTVYTRSLFYNFDQAVSCTEEELASALSAADLGGIVGGVGSASSASGKGVWM
ncbi:hypothetical protein CCP4SC76_3570005 [Gammaproteobacteria bacterium]